VSPPFLILNQSQIFNGLGTLTFIVPKSGTYSVGAQVTVPEAKPTGDGAGSGKGPGSGAGGGDVAGFARGGDGLGDGGVGQGFGPVANVYPQPPPYPSNQTFGPQVTSGVTVVVNQNGTPVYTSPTLGVDQKAMQFRQGFQFVLNDSVTVVIGSGVATDQQLSGVSSNVFIQQGY
jgi:hypothetical protein